MTAHHWLREVDVMEYREFSRLFGFSRTGPCGWPLRRQNGVTSMKTVIDDINEDLLGFLPAQGGNRLRGLVKGYRIRVASVAAVLSFSGRLANIQELPDGRRLIIDFYGENTPFLNADDGCTTQYLKVVDSNAEVMIWSTAQLAGIYQRQPTFWQYVNDWFRYQHWALLDRLAEFATCRIEERLRLALLRLGRQFGAQTAIGIKVPPFTHQDLADYVATSREIISHYMRDSARNGLISYNRQGIVLHGLGKEMVAAT